MCRLWVSVLNRLKASDRYDRIERAQAVAWGLLFTLVLILVAAALIDLYRLVEVRNWAYSVAEEAARGGASQGRDWAYAAASGQMRLNAMTARNQAMRLVEAEMAYRGILDYAMYVQVLPDPTGGTADSYPPRTIRLGEGLGDWTADEPAVGVYLEVYVSNLSLLRFAGLSSGWVHIFVSAGIGQTGE